MNITYFFNLFCCWSISTVHPLLFILFSDHHSSLLQLYSSSLECHHHLLFCIPGSLLLLSSVKRPSKLHHHPQTVEVIFPCCACVTSTNPNFKLITGFCSCPCHRSALVKCVTNHCQLSKSINHHRQEHLCYCQSSLYHCFIVVTTMPLLTAYLAVS